VATKCPLICPSIVLSAAVLVLVLETAHYVVVVEYRGHACRCFATPRFLLARFRGLVSEADTWHCFAIQSPTAFSAVESQRDGQVIASDANPRLGGGMNSQSRNATACVGFGCDSEHEHEHEHEHGYGNGNEFRYGYEYDNR
jgi:hypothetical protein